MHSMREVQQLIIQMNNTFDTVSITVDNPDSGTFAIIFQNPATSLYTKSEPIPANASPNQIRTAVLGYYASSFNSYIWVTKQMFD